MSTRALELLRAGLVAVMQAHEFLEGGCVEEARALLGVAEDNLVRALREAEEADDIRPLRRPETKSWAA